MTFISKVVYFAIVVFEKKPCALRYNGNQKRKEVITSMKKLISLALCLGLALAFAAGCKKKEEAPAPAAPAVEQKAPEQKPMSSAKAPEAAPAAPAAPAEKKH